MADMVHEQVQSYRWVGEGDERGNEGRSADLV